MQRSCTKTCRIRRWSSAANGPETGRVRTFDPLLEPFELKGLTLRNRVVSTSHEPAYAEDGMPKDRYRL